MYHADDNYTSSLCFYKGFLFAAEQITAVSVRRAPVHSQAAMGSSLLPVTHLLPIASYSYKSRSIESQRGSDARQSSDSQAYSSSVCIYRWSLEHGPEGKQRMNLESSRSEDWVTKA